VRINNAHIVDKAPFTSHNYC